MEDFQRSPAAQAWWQLAETQQALQAARQTADVDYTAVTALKLTALRLAWAEFSTREDEQMAEFRQFVLREGESLYWQAALMRCMPGKAVRIRCAGAGRHGRKRIRARAARR